MLLSAPWMGDLAWEGSRARLDLGLPPAKFFGYGNVGIASCPANIPSLSSPADLGCSCMS